VRSELEKILNSGKMTNKTIVVGGISQYVNGTVHEEYSFYRGGIDVRYLIRTREGEELPSVLVLEIGFKGTWKKTPSSFRREVSNNIREELEDMARKDDKLAKITFDNSQIVYFLNGEVEPVSTSLSRWSGTSAA